MIAFFHEYTDDMNAKAAKGRQYYIGIMSGTSLDGADAILADLSNVPITVRATSFVPFDKRLRDTLLTLHKDEKGALRLAATVANKLVRLYAKSVAIVLANAGLQPKDIIAIGCHGQTILHRPDLGWTLQLNNPSLLAELSGITVVSDFRSRDVAAGGQGAPLVPAFHDAIFRHPTSHRVILNIGGIANITNLKPGKATIGFDTGPGNMLMDDWIYKQKKIAFDKDGTWAAGGVVIPKLLKQLLADSYFRVKPPKSSGRDLFNAQWYKRYLKPEFNNRDVQATLLELTCITIAEAITQYCRGAKELYLCGGGALNTALRCRLAGLIPGVRIAKSTELGVGTQDVEALAFAWLAQQTILGRPGNLPEVSGARGKRILGGIYQK